MPPLPHLRPLVKEKQRYFCADSVPLAVIRMTDQDPAMMHVHEFSEIVLVFGGQGIHQTGSVSYSLRAGDVFVIHPGTSHGYRDVRRLSLINILFDSSELDICPYDIARLPGFHALFALEPKLRGRPCTNARLRLSHLEQPQAQILVDALDTELSRGQAGWQYGAVAAFMTLVLWLSRRYAEYPSTQGVDVLRLGNVLSFLETHFAENITVGAICERACMSRTSLYRHFSRAVGCSPIEYAIQLRIARAAELLRNSDVLITEIAMRVGFVDSSYFTRQFRRLMRATPREYRSKNPAINASVPK